MIAMKLIVVLLRLFLSYSYQLLHRPIATDSGTVPFMIFGREVLPRVRCPSPQADIGVLICKPNQCVETAQFTFTYII